MKTEYEALEAAKQILADAIEWECRVPMLQDVPESATRAEIARLATELLEARDMLDDIAHGRLEVDVNTHSFTETEEGARYAASERGRYRKPVS